MLSEKKDVVVRKLFDANFEEYDDMEVNCGMIRMKPLELCDNGTCSGGRRHHVKEWKVSTK